MFVPADANLYNHVDQMLGGHEILLSDARRNRQLFQALKKHVTPATAVLDIGSGTGLWAIAAARLGARRVVAIEHNPLLIGLIKQLAVENDVADRIEVIHGDSRQLNLAREFDLVISETIGSLVFNEPIVPVMLDARARFLKPGGVLIPAAVSLLAAPAHFKSNRLPAGVEVAYASFESLILNLPAPLKDKRQVKFAGAAQSLIQADLTTLTAPPGLTNLTARWQLPNASQVNCCVVWGEAQLSAGISLSTLHSPNWTPVVYRFEPFPPEAGELEFKLALTGESNYWTVTWSTSQTGQTRQTQSYSPAQAATALLAQMPVKA